MAEEAAAVVLEEHFLLARLETRQFEERDSVEVEQPVERVCRGWFRYWWR